MSNLPTRERAARNIEAALYNPELDDEEAVKLLEDAVKLLRPETKEKSLRLRNPETDDTMTRMKQTQETTDNISEREWSVDSFVIKSSKFGSEFRLFNRGRFGWGLAARPMTVDPVQQAGEEWYEIDWERGVEPEDLEAMRSIERQLRWDQA